MPKPCLPDEGYTTCRHKTAEDGTIFCYTKKSEYFRSPCPPERQRRYPFHGPFRKWASAIRLYIPDPVTGEIPARIAGAHMDAPVDYFDDCPKTGWLYDWCDTPWGTLDKKAEIIRAAGLDPENLPESWANLNNPRRSFLCLVDEPRCNCEDCKKHNGPCPREVPQPPQEPDHA